MIDVAATSGDDIGASTSDRRIAASQLLFSLLALVGIGVVIVTAHLIVPRGEMLEAKRVAEWKQANGTYSDARFFTCPEERLLYDELPAADFSNGGVYFMGGSQMQRSLMLWDLPEAEHKRIHNYCLAGTMDTREFEFLKFLVEKQNLLKAGGENNLVVLDLCFTASAHYSTASAAILNSVWEDHFLKFGMYTYGPSAGIQPVDMPELWRYARIEGIRTQEFSTWVTRVMMRKDLAYMTTRSEPSAEYCRWWSDYFGPKWADGMDLEIHQLADMVDYLQAHHVNFVAVYLPLGSWFDHFPPAIRFRSRVLPMLAAKHASMIDLNHQLPDTDFADSVHFTYTGSKKISPMMVDLARQFLRHDARDGAFVPAVDRSTH